MHSSDPQPTAERRLTLYLRQHTPKPLHANATTLPSRYVPTTPCQDHSRFIRYSSCQERAASKTRPPSSRTGTAQRPLISSSPRPSPTPPTPTTRPYHALHSPAAALFVSIPHPCCCALMQSGPSL